jgi:KDEL-tailed cysteine endopeptidase
LVDLSEQELVDCAKDEGNNGCNGGWYHWAWNYVARKGGLYLQKDYKYQTADGTCQELAKKERHVKISTDHVELPANPETIKDKIA